MKEEIKLVHVHIETPLLINENFPQLLIVENPAEFYRFVSDLDRQMEGLEGEFVFPAMEILFPRKSMERWSVIRFTLN